MTRLICSVVIAVLALVETSCTTPLGPQALLPSPTPAKEVIVEEGKFLISDFNIVLRYGTPTAFASVLNNTSKDWKQVKFKLVIFSQSGAELKSAKGMDFAFTVYDIKKGQIKPIGVGYGETLFDLPATSIGGWEVSFLSGHYPVNYKFALKKASPDRSLIFEDENVLIQFMVTQSGIDFIMKNKSVGPIKIDWDQAAYVDVMSKSHKVLHAGVRYMERDKPQAPTIVPPNANVEELIFPTDYVNFVSGLYGGWTKDPLFPDGPAAKPYKGQSFSVFMPIEVRGTIKNYAFDFVIEEVQS